MTAAPHPVLVLVVYTLAAMRITRLLNFDSVLDRPRMAAVSFVRGNPVFVYFITCPWCIGFWVCLFTAWAPMWHADNRTAQYIGIALAASQIIGMAAPLSDDPTVHQELTEDEQRDADND